MREDLLGTLVEGTAGETGLPFFRALVKNLSEALGTHGAWVTEYIPESNRLRAIALRLGGEWIPHYEYDVSGTPCGAAIDKKEVLYVEDRVADLFPGDNDLKPLGAISYIGAALFDETGEKLLGHLAVLDTKVLRDRESYVGIFRIFASRAAAELRRLNLERELRARTDELNAIVQSAMDAILILDHEHEIVRANRAAIELFGTTELKGQMIDRYLTVDGAGKLDAILGELAEGPSARKGHPWIAGGVEARSATGTGFSLEGTVSRFALNGRFFFTLVLRNINDRLEAEARINVLRNQSAYLREEVERHYNEIIGESPPMRRVIQEIAEVAGTDATVLITGETGTGKELIARALHRASRRHERPLIKVNCAAIPPQLIESEFFGHERGAFTGATARREGRFSLADGGTIFLDEIGELPVELQAKLLRVLQEGEFEPVGSSSTRKVDVRVIAATNRDLRKEAEEGRFREDLYYRLAVFPLHIPALRTRGTDIGLLARAFVDRFSARNDRAAVAISDRDLERLQSYHWPGNVRELANVIERALITGDRIRLNLDRALPMQGDSPLPSIQPPEETILTVRELEEIEVANLRRALRKAHGRISGPNGAATLLGLKPTTLSSRLKALGLSPNDEIS